MRKWLINHPYFLTSAIFIVIIIVGWQLLYWGWENFAFLLLLYFIVTLGIRLDDISRKIGSESKTVSPDSDEKDSILSQLNEIKLSLRSLDNTLKQAFERAQKKKGSQNNPD